MDFGALDELNTSDLLLIYEMVLKLKDASTQGKKSKFYENPPYQRVRKALVTCKGQFSNDIIEMREERL